MSRLSQQQGVLIGLAGTMCASLLYQVIFPIASIGTPQSKLRAALASLAITPSTVPQTSRDESLYQVIAGKPLFSSTRQPDVTSNAGLPPSPVNLSLVGIIHAPDTLFAVVHIAGNQNLVVLQLGSNVQGWIVSKIDLDRITFKNGQTTQTIAFQQGNND